MSYTEVLSFICLSNLGSDGHTLALNYGGEIFSWGDGDYGKLGHGTSATQKFPKIIQGPLLGKVNNEILSVSWLIAIEFFT